MISRRAVTRAASRGEGAAAVGDWAAGMTVCGLLCPVAEGMGAGCCCVLTGCGALGFLGSWNVDSGAGAGAAGAGVKASGLIGDAGGSEGAVIGGADGKVDAGLWV